MNSLYPSPQITSQEENLLKYIFLPVLERWTWQHFKVQGKGSINISSFYHPIPSAQGGVTGYMYAQHITNFSANNTRIYPLHEFMAYMEIQMTTWTNEGYQLNIMGDLNKYI